ncbi:MAG TPA: hypothetical protein VGS58_19835 [Candidatus Sulfopaludibacter sp.]|nr:hypothetical protein [Candidatus Sulfopaludibacter sp.]
MIEIRTPFSPVFGRVEVLFRFFGESLAMVPGIAGNYLRAAFYRFTLSGWDTDSYIGTGSWFAHFDASAGAHVGIGSYCILGSVRLGDRTMVASGAQTLSGSGQHARDENGRLTDEGRTFRIIEVGAGCWIGPSRFVSMAVLLLNRSHPDGYFQPPSKSTISLPGTDI